MADLTAVRGDTNEYDVLITRKDTNNVDQALDLTGATLKFTVKRSLDDTDAGAVLQKTIGAGITLAADQPGVGKGKATIKLNPADTTGLPERAFHYDLELTEPDGRVTTTAIGLLRLTADVETS